MRALRATLVSTIVTCTIVTTLILVGTLDAHSNADDSGAVQGFSFFVLAAGVAVASVVVLFPFVALRLERRGVFTRRRWTRQVLAGTAGLALAASVLSVSSLFGGSLLDVVEILTLAVVFFCITIVLLIPISPLWLWIARAPKGNSASSV
jgi:hypothetical protein